MDGRAIEISLDRVGSELLPAPEDFMFTGSPAVRNPVVAVAAILTPQGGPCRGGKCPSGKISSHCVREEKKNFWGLGERRGGVSYVWFKHSSDLES